jgi:hypothetical protein
MRDRSLPATLERIQIWLEENAPMVASSLQPGLTREQLRLILGPKSDTFRLPEEIVKLYEWRNGQSGKVPFFDVLRFQTFEEAVEYGNLVEKYFDGTFPLMILQELCYDAGYQARCVRNDETIAPTYRWDHGEERIETESLSELFLAIAEGFENGAFRLNESGEFETNDEVWNGILVQHNPERTRGVETLLARRWDDLRSDKFRDALYDLVRMKHPEVPELIHEFLGKNPNTAEQDFEGFHSALHSGIAIEDLWTRDFALDLIFSKSSLARKTALLALAWSWRGELVLSTQHVDALISQIATDSQSDSENRERAMLLGVSGDRRAIPTLVKLLAECDSREVAIASARALAQLGAIESQPLLLTIAQRTDDPGTRITAIRALVDLGFQDEAVERAAKVYYQQMVQVFGKRPERETSATLQRWREEVERTFD